MLHLVRLAGPEDEISPDPPEVEQTRGYVEVPSYDVQRYVRGQFVTFAAGFVVGMGIGALFGNVIRQARRAP